jgi:Uncharacterized protein, linocin/CFP29 homolog
MSYLSRESSPVSPELWNQIDTAVVNAARIILTGRKFLHLFGPLGIGVSNINVDDADGFEEVSKDGFITTKGRKIVELPVLFEDFTLFARELESNGKTGFPVDLSRVMSAAEACALKEDKLIFWGNSDLGLDGLLTADGSNKITKTDWAKGENAYSDISSAIEILSEKSIYGTYALTLSPDLLKQLQRIQPAAGLLEIDRISKLLYGRIYQTPVLGKNKAVLVCADQRNMDLAVGQDIETAYLEQKDLNHSFRVLESVLLRLKRKQAIVVFE